MTTVNIHEAKTQLSKLVEQAAQGEPFVIARAGKPLVKVAALDAPPAPRRLGFMAGEIVVPDDFDRTGEAEIAVLFGIGASTAIGANYAARQRLRFEHGQQGPVPLPLVVGSEPEARQELARALAKQ